MITEDYVSYGVAKLLKKKGFDVPCLASYHIEYPENSPVWTPKPVNDEGWIFMNAPTHQMAMKWLRDVHKLHIEIIFSNVAWAAVIGDMKNNDEIHQCEWVESYEEAVEAALKYSLEKLI